MASRKRPPAKSRLRAYRAKRRFAVTPEPEPERPAPPTVSGPLFVVHKHDAARLHYDLRLEMDGVLVSWAIPKGPSVDTTERRLAVQTEDHPLSYGEFEGRIPDGEYGGGDSLLWDRGTWRTEPPGNERQMMEKGHLTFVLEGEKLHGRWHLVRTRSTGAKSQWLFFKGKDEFSAKDRDLLAERPESVVSGRRVTRGPVRKKTLEAPHPEPLDLLLKVWPPMFAMPSTKEAVAGRPALYEVKYDGFRALAAISGGRIVLQSRNGLDLSVQFPAVVKAIREIVVAEAVLDGEIVALDENGNARFQLLQRSQGELQYAVFDLLWLDGDDLRARPLEERRDLLASLLANVDPPVVLAERLDGPLDAALGEVRRRELEGLIAKRAGSSYRSGVRGPDWAKVKVQLSQEFAVVGFTPISNKRPAIGALLLGVIEERGGAERRGGSPSGAARGRQAEGGGPGAKPLETTTADQGRNEGKGYRYVGKVGTGFTDATRRELFETLSREVLEKRPPGAGPKGKDARWVRPRLVAQVVFREWTDEGLVRQPAFQGLRPDKRPEECAREIPVSAPERRPAWRTRWTGEDWPST